MGAPHLAVQEGILVTVFLCTLCRPCLTACVLAASAPRPREAEIACVSAEYSFLRCWLRLGVFATLLRPASCRLVLQQVAQVAQVRPPDWQRAGGLQDLGVNWTLGFRGFPPLFSFWSGSQCVCCILGPLLGLGFRLLGLVSLRLLAVRSQLLYAVNHPTV